MSKAIKQEEFAADHADEHPILESEESFFKETPIFTGDHGDPYFDEEQAFINEQLACNYDPDLITERGMPCGTHIHQE